MLNDVTTSPEANNTTASPKEADKRPPCPEIRTRAIGELKLNPKSPRRHDRKKIKNLAGLIKEVGYRVPILVDRDGQVIAGHARILACQELGWTEIPTISVEGLSEAQCKALMIADNRLAEMAEWDDRLLAEQLRDICLAEIS